MNRFVALLRQSYPFFVWLGLVVSIFMVVQFLVPVGILYNYPFFSTLVGIGILTVFVTSGEMLFNAILFRALIHRRQKSSLLQILIHVLLTFGLIASLFGVFGFSYSLKIMRELKLYGRETTGVVTHHEPTRKHDPHFKIKVQYITADGTVLNIEKTSKTFKDLFPGMEVKVIYSSRTPSISTLLPE